MKLSSLKYKNQPVHTDEGYFASQAEHRRWCLLKLRQRAGEIEGLKRQVTYQLNVNGFHICDYIADATYTEIKPAPGFVVEDAKGVETKDFKIKAKLFEAIFGFKIRVVRT